jgi:mannitol-1-phosphate/altronate dehydrogenase
VRLVVTIGEALRAGRPVHRLMMPIAAWMRFIARQAKAGVPIVDPDATRLASIGAACTVMPFGSAQIFRLRIGAAAGTDERGTIPQGTRDRL